MENYIDKKHESEILSKEKHAFKVIFATDLPISLEGYSYLMLHFLNKYGAMGYSIEESATKAFQHDRKNLVYQRTPEKLHDYFDDLFLTQALETMCQKDMPLLANLKIEIPKDLKITTKSKYHK